MIGSSLDIWPAPQMKRNAPTMSALLTGGMPAAASVVLTLKLEAIAGAPVAPTGAGEGPGVGVGVGGGGGGGVGVGFVFGGSDLTVTRAELSGWTSVLQPESKVSRSDDASAA